MIKTIGIYGIAGVYNLGCEAIIRGTYENFKTQFPNARWIYYTPNQDLDKSVLSDLPIEIRKTKEKFVFIKKCFNKIFDILKIGYQIPYDDYRNIINNVDMIISVGGDIYTIPAYLREKKKYPYYNRLVEFGNIALNQNKKIIIYGASIGPFGEYQKAITYFKDHLNKIDLIVVREKSTMQYLKNINIASNVVFSPDPAFSLRQNEKYSKNYSDTIGINLSGLSLIETYGKISNEAIRSLAEIIEKIINDTGYNIYFIPHVFAPHEIDNDFIIQKKIISFLGEKYKEKIAITDNNTFLSVKNDLSKCSMVVAARMHCAINAMSEGVPTILLSYSSKAKGMCEFVYGNTKWVYDIKELNNEKFIYLIKDMLEHRDEINRSIVDNLNKKLAKEKYSDMYNALSNIVNS